MAATVSDFVVERLRAWGVRRVYGYPGDGINGVAKGMTVSNPDDVAPAWDQANH